MYVSIALSVEVGQRAVDDKGGSSWGRDGECLMNFVGVHV